MKYKYLLESGVSILFCFQECTLPLVNMCKAFVGMYIQMPCTCYIRKIGAPYTLQQSCLHLQGKDDYQTEADRSAQKCIIASLSSQYPKMSIIGEEDNPDVEVLVYSNIAFL